MAKKIKCDCGVTFEVEEGQTHCNYCGIKLSDIGKKKPVEKKKGRGCLILIGLLIGFFILIVAIGGSGEKEKATPTPTERQEETNEEDLSISKDRFNYYNETYLKFSVLQNEYEQEYAKFGVVGFEEAKAIPEDAEFPKYGSKTREIASIFHSLPKFNTNMSSGEKHLLFKIADYGSSLIFMTPKENGIEGMDYVLESREALEDALKKVKDFNAF